MAAAAAEQQQFYLLLGNLLSPDNVVRKQAEVSALVAQTPCPGRRADPPRDTATPGLGRSAAAAQAGPAGGGSSAHVGGGARPPGVPGALPTLAAAGPGAGVLPPPLAHTCGRS